MGVSATIFGTPYAALTAPTVSGRYLKSCSPEYPMDQVLRYHPMGTTGNLKVFGGDAGQRIPCVLVYIDTLANVLSNYAADFNTFYNGLEGDIVYGGVTYKRCTPEPGGIKVLRDPFATGRGSSFVRMDVSAIFICDGGAS